MMKWFDGVKNVEGLRKKYRELLKEYHPDNENGSTEITQQINQEYDLVFGILSKENKSDSQSYTYVKYAFPVSKEVMDSLRGNVADVETCVLLSHKNSQTSSTSL